MEESNKILMRERVVVQKMDHSGDEPVVVETVTQEVTSEVSQIDALLMGWRPAEVSKEMDDLRVLTQLHKQANEPLALVQIGGSDGGGLSVGD